MNNTITIHYALFISEGTRYFTSTESLSSIQNKIDETTRNCISSFESFGKKTKYEPGAFLYGTFTDAQNQNDYFVITFVVSRLDELAKRETNFRYQAILPLKDFKALCAAGYEINAIIKTLFTKNLLILKNKSHHYKPELAKQLTPEEIKHIALFDYQLGLKQVQAQFQDQSLFEDSLTALIYDNRFQLHFGKLDLFLLDWDKDTADLTMRKDSQGEAFVSALWHLLPLQTRMQRGVSTGLPDKDDAMYKACDAKNVAAIALQFQNSTTLKAASEQALKRIDTHAQDFQSIKTHYVKPLLAAIEADDSASVLALQKNYTIESQPNQEQTTVSKSASKNHVHANPSKENRTFFKWLPIGLIAFLSLMILFLLTNEEPINTDNETQRLEWEQSHKELTQIKQTVLPAQTQGWSVDAFLQDWNAKKQSQLELVSIKAMNADKKAQAENQPDSTQQQSECQPAAHDLEQNKQAFDAEKLTSEKLISHLRSLKLESETNQQVVLLEALLSKNWNMKNIQTWQDNSAAYEKAQDAYTAQAKKQEKLQKEHSAMQSLLEALMAKNWTEAEQQSSQLVNFPTVKEKSLRQFVDYTKTLTEKIKVDEELQLKVDSFLESFKVATLEDVKKKLKSAESDFIETQRKLNNAQTNLRTKNGELEKANKIINGYTQQVQNLENDFSTAKSTITVRENEINQLATKLDAIEQNNKKAQDLLGLAKTSINATALNTDEGNNSAAKEIYFEILALSPNNSYVEATVGLFYGIPEKYKSLPSKQRFQWLKDYETDLRKKASTLQDYLKKFNAGGNSADLEFDSISSEIKRAEGLLKAGNISLAINAYRDILSQNADAESAKFGLTVLVPLYYLLNNEIELALSYLENDFSQNKLDHHYELINNSINNIKAHYQKVAENAENKNKVILESLNEYFQQYSKLLKAAKQGSNSGLLQDEVEPKTVEPKTIEPKVQKVFDIVEGYIELLDLEEKIKINKINKINQDLESKEKKLSAYKQEILSILKSQDCKGDYWVKSSCITKLKTELQQY